MQSNNCVGIGVNSMTLRKQVLLICLIASTYITTIGVADALPRYVLTTSNRADKNSVFVYDRARDGRLTLQGRVSTRGKGRGSFVANQNGLIVDGSDVLTVNTGSNELSYLRITQTGVRFVSIVPVNGSNPVSVARRGELVYVVSEGDSARAANITGYRLSGGTLSAIDGAVSALSTSDAGPAQISFSPDGAFLVVTERNTNQLTIASVDQSTGMIGALSSFPSPGMTPWGFEFARSGALVVSEAFGGSDSAVSSYNLSALGALSVVSSSVDAGSETDACWITVTSNGRTAFVTNTNVGSISSYRISEGGQLTLLQARAARNGGLPIDVDLSRDNRFLYTLNFSSGKIEVYRVLTGGRLSGVIQEVAAPNGGNGLWVK